MSYWLILTEVFCICPNGQVLRKETEKKNAQTKTKNL